MNKKRDSYDRTRFLRYSKEDGYYLCEHCFDNNNCMSIKELNVTWNYGLCFVFYIHSFIPICVLLYEYLFNQESMFINGLMKNIDILTFYIFLMLVSVLNTYSIWHRLLFSQTWIFSNKLKYYISATISILAVSLYTIVTFTLIACIIDSGAIYKYYLCLTDIPDYFWYTTKEIAISIYINHVFLILSIVTYSFIWVMNAGYIVQTIVDMFFLIMFMSFMLLHTRFNISNECISVFTNYLLFILFSLPFRVLRNKEENNNIQFLNKKIRSRFIKWKRRQSIYIKITIISSIFCVLLSAITYYMLYNEIKSIGSDLKVAENMKEDLTIMVFESE